MEPWGEFGAVRKFDIHTGIDFYAPQGDQVYAIEDGVVVNVCHFTGKNAGSPWWNDTRAVFVEGASGVICYGEISECEGIAACSRVSEGEVIGRILTVLRRDKGFQMSMLHLELYEHGYRGDGEVWINERPAMLKDPSVLFGDELKCANPPRS